MHGNFAHNPEPLKEHLTELCSEIERGGYDLGITVDPDVDRLAFVNNDGSVFGEEYTLVAVSDYVLKHTPGNTVSNLSSTKSLKSFSICPASFFCSAATFLISPIMLFKMPFVPNHFILNSSTAFASDTIVASISCL